MSDHLPNISRRLYNVLEHVGASEDMRRLHQASGISSGITDTIYHHINHRPGSVFIFGSSCEGTTTPGLNSDIDVLICHDDHTVIENIRDAAGYDASYLMVRDNHTQPGYVKLQLVKNGRPQTVYTMAMPDNYDSDCEGRICIKHITSCDQIDGINERNGPADSFINEVVSADFVIAYRSASVPDFASEWTRQPRPYCWPPVHMINQMKTRGCFAVGVGHPASDEKHIEWRLSFSLQERQLMFNFNPVQHKCYILLKMIKNDLITPDTKPLKSISSYHCKTCMFYVIANTNTCIWRPENLFSCVRLCLIILRSFVMNGICPNYFIREENMFDRDVHRNVKPRLTELLTQMISEGPAMLLRIRCDQIGDILKGQANFYQLFQVQNRHMAKLKRAMIMHQSMLRNGINRLLNKSDLVSNCRWLSTFIRDLTSCTYFKDRDEQHIREQLPLILPFLHSRLAQQCVSLACSEYVQGTPFMNRLLHASNYHFQEGRTCEVTSSRLVYASVLYKFGQYDSCLSLLDQINADLQPAVETVCCCDDGESLANSSHVNMPSSLSSTASCVMFLSSEVAITPTPLQYEMFRSVDTPLGSRDEEEDYWYDCAVLDGKVYVPFLQYLVYSKLNKVMHKRLSIANLRCVIENDRNLGHRETGCNLLGWIYIQENRIVEGVQCFCESLKIRPHHNAAKWHFRSVMDTFLRLQTIARNTSGSGVN